MLQPWGAAIAAAMWFAGLWKGLQALRRPGSRGIRLLCLLYLSFAATVTVWSWPAPFDSLFSTVLGPSSSALIRNVTPIGVLCVGTMFLLYSSGRNSRTAHVRRIWIPAAIWAAAALSAWFLTPPSDRGDSLTDVASPGHVVFYAVTLTGLAYFTACLGAPLTFGLARRAPDRIAARALQVAGLGFVILAVLFVGPRLVALVVALTGRPPLPVFEQASVAGQLVGLALVLAGFGWPVLRARVVAGRLWLSHRRLIGRMRPLWVALAGVSRHYGLLREEHSRFVPVRVHHRFYRCVVECRDALVVAGRLVDRDASPSTVEAEADMLVEVVEDRAAGAPVTPGPPGWIFAATTSDDVEDDARALAALAAALPGRASRPATRSSHGGERSRRVRTTPRR